MRNINKKYIFIMFIFSVYIVTGCANKVEESKIKENDILFSEIGENSINETTYELNEEESVIKFLEMEEVESDFNYNNMYNSMVCCYGDDTYIYRYGEMYYRGIDEKEELIFDNPGISGGGMTNYNEYIFFCGSPQNGEYGETTIYRMNVDTKEVTDVLKDFGKTYQTIYDPYIRDHKLYVTIADFSMEIVEEIAFEFNDDGEILGRIDEDLEKVTGDDDSSEFYEMYVDSFYVDEFLDGNQVVSVPAELKILYIKKDAEEYEYLCETSHDPILTMNGVYYIDSGKIFYVDYETTKEVEVFQADGMSDINLANYDKEYVYFTIADMQTNEDGLRVYEQYLMRISRITGMVEEVHHFVDYYEMTLYMKCGVDAKHMYFDYYSTISLE